ncbi:MAG: tetratricopeptide repeat protein [Aquabacterium sp.]|nr:tetratricopeptide repeat protein [Aquabacterium sp.]
MSAASRPSTSKQARAQRSWQQGRLHAKQGQWDQAIKAFRAAVSMAPQDDVYVLNEAQALYGAGRHDESLKSAKRAIALNPANELARLMAARVLVRRHAFQEAVDCLRAMPVDAPRGREYWEQLGLALQQLGLHQEAIDAFMSALAVKMDEGITHYRMGLSFYELQLKEEASECFRTGLVLGVGSHEVHVRGMLAYAERENVRWPQAEAELAALDAVLRRLPSTTAVLTSPFSHVTLSGDPLNQLKAARLFANTWADVPRMSHQPRTLDGRRLRVGYVSADFHQHATCVLITEMLEHRDTDRFEVFLYSHGKDDGSAMRQRVMAACDHFVEIRKLNDNQAAQRIRDDGIDVLVDLKGYTAGNRLGIFARRPAPVQVSFLGFPGTTGAPFIDYIVGDPIVTPIEHADYYSEKIAQMPVCYQPNDRKRPLPGLITRSQVGLPEDKLVLCGFNQPYKISAEVLDVWCRLLHQLPDAVLWLLDWHEQAKPHLTREISARGIEPHRIVWAPKMPLAPHITRFSLADVFLDTWPCNGHTTVSDALWAGVPVITFAGQTFASRVACSLLRATGLERLASSSLEQYEQTVLRLAGSASERAEYRQVLRQARDSAPLFDTPRFTADFESLLGRAWERHMRGERPSHLVVC